MADAIKVIVRLRPRATEANDVPLGTTIQVLDDKQTLMAHTLSDTKIFKVDKVAEEDTSQSDLFTYVGKEIVEGCVAGYNGTVFAYGQTGSGKTFTMLGSNDDSGSSYSASRGVIPRSLEYLFELVQKEQESGKQVLCTCKCSFIEIYNEQVHDLLGSATSSLALREHAQYGVYVDGVQEQVISEASEAWTVVCKGLKHRKVASTVMNADSSRSHGIFTVSLQSKVISNGKWNETCSKFHMVDLAGSERQKDTGTSGERLKDSLGGNAKTCLIACVNLNPKCLGETMSTLRFAHNARFVKNKAVVNKDKHGSSSAHQHLKVNLPSMNSKSLEHGADSFKAKFLQAMQLFSKSEVERKSVMESLKQQQDLCINQEQALNQMRMALACREVSLQKVENELKEQLEPRTDDRDKIIEQLKSEVAHYQEENEALKTEVLRLRTEASNAQLDDETVEELENLFTELQAESGEVKAKKTKDPLEVPVSTLPSLKTATPTIHHLGQTEQLKRPECRDLIVLGLSWKSGESTLNDYFSQFGELAFVEVKRDIKTKQSKGFGFIRFTDYESQLKALSQRHLIDNRWCDIRIPNSKDGLPLAIRHKIHVSFSCEDMTAEHLRSHFEQFGRVTDVFLPDSFRAFAFITFADAEVAQTLCDKSQMINGTSVFVRSATAPNIDKGAKKQMQTGQGLDKTDYTMGRPDAGVGENAEPGFPARNVGSGGATQFSVHPGLMAAAQPTIGQGLLGILKLIQDRSGGLSNVFPGASASGSQPRPPAPGWK